MHNVIFGLVIWCGDRPVWLCFAMADEPAKVRLVYRDIPFQQDNVIFGCDLLEASVTVILVVEPFILVHDVRTVRRYDSREAADDSHSSPRMMFSSSRETGVFFRMNTGR